MFHKWTIVVMCILDTVPSSEIDPRSRPIRSRQGTKLSGVPERSPSKILRRNLANALPIGGPKSSTFQLNTPGR